jgi:hypothetical protein
MAGAELLPILAEQLVSPGPSPRKARAVLPGLSFETERLLDRGAFARQESTKRESMRAAIVIIASF